MHTLPFFFKTRPSACMLLTAMLLVGCAEFSSKPERIIATEGNAVRDLVQQSMYDPKKTQNPKPNLPDGMEGQKGEAVLQRMYQPDLGVPPRVRAPSQIGVNPAGGATP